MADRRRPGVRGVGADAVSRLRKSSAERIADLMQRDPATLARAVELGLVRREWIDNPGEGRFAAAGPAEVLARWFESEVERRPSTLAALGLSTIQILTASSPTDDDSTEGTVEELTVVFTDLEGFTAFTEREGDDVAGRYLADHQRVVGPIVRSRGGRMVKHLGDGLLVTFPSPEAAVLAGLELVDAPLDPLRLRVGMHAGELRVMRNNDVVGHVVNVAARVVESAHGGEVLATAAVRDAVVDLPGVEFGRLRRRGFKGVDEPVGVCPVRRAEPA
jgi:class 3 adenylate cyclase